MHRKECQHNTVVDQVSLLREESQFQWTSCYTERSLEGRGDKALSPSRGLVLFLPFALILGSPSTL